MRVTSSKVCALYGEALVILDRLKSPKAEPVRRWLEKKAQEQSESGES